MPEHLLPLIAGPLSGLSVGSDCPIDDAPSALEFRVGKERITPAGDSTDRLAAYWKQDDRYWFVGCHPVGIARGCPACVDGPLE